MKGTFCQTICGRDTKKFSSLINRSDASWTVLLALCCLFIIVPLVWTVTLSDFRETSSSSPVLHEEAKRWISCHDLHLGLSAWRCKPVEGVDMTTCHVSWPLVRLLFCAATFFWMFFDQESLSRERAHRNNCGRCRWVRQKWKRIAVSVIWEGGALAVCGPLEANLLWSCSLFCFLVFFSSLKIWYRDFATAASRKKRNSCACHSWESFLPPWWVLSEQPMVSSSAG